jgi:hypothetical protein
VFNCTGGRQCGSAIDIRPQQRAEFAASSFYLNQLDNGVIRASDILLYACVFFGNALDIGQAPNATVAVSWCVFSSDLSMVDGRVVELGENAYNTATASYTLQDVHSVSFCPEIRSAPRTLTRRATATPLAATLGPAPSPSSKLPSSGVYSPSPRPRWSDAHSPSSGPRLSPVYSPSSKPLLSAVYSLSSGPRLSDAHSPSSNPLLPDAYSPSSNPAGLEPSSPARSADLQASRVPAQSALPAFNATGDLAAPDSEGQPDRALVPSDNSDSGVVTRVAGVLAALFVAALVLLLLLKRRKDKGPKRGAREGSVFDELELEPQDTSIYVSQYQSNEPRRPSGAADGADASAEHDVEDESEFWQPSQYGLSDAPGGTGSHQRRASGAPV